MGEQLIYGVAAIAKRIGMPKRACQHHIDCGRIPVFRLGKVICAGESAIDKWLREMTANGGGEK